MARAGELPRPLIYAAWGVGGAMAIVSLVVLAEFAGVYDSALANGRAPITLATLESKVQPAVGHVPEQDVPRYRAWLGQERFEEMNNLLHWAALAAAMSPDCGRVTSNVLSALHGDRDNFVFVAECATAQPDVSAQFLIGEADAVRYRDALRGLELSDTVAALQPPPAYDRVLQESRWFGDGMTACEAIIRLAAVSPDLDFSWDQTKSGPYPDGTMTLQRSFIARNAFNARINGAYRCDYDVREDRVRQLETRDAGGWRTLLGG